ncbi:hypothetical protein GZ77_03045 [Endozoicomonas montiporae]|uniref:Uncharacterized protein n=2 Tax=Endozoicomonas montiporae TaxID=1027273 RepID=A0A081NAX7_9GAMM|nr:sulfurtransferase complex subunit TusC [Endozoicomonas montiporae]AMO56699.1 DsrE/DsrF-like family [Endozoicomonas montiporae CL-33]KEQ15600.1 hypothetical protein GZ77_03045 [Endozoicomonas montiporae]
MNHSVCIISTRAPYHGHAAREALDAALVSASYDLNTSVLLMGDGVYQLLNHQSPEQLPRKNLSALLKALPLYGIDSVFVDYESLQERDISEDQLSEGYTLLEEGGLAPFIAQHDKVLNF